MSTDTDTEVEDHAEPDAIAVAPPVTPAHGASADVHGEATAQQLKPIAALDTDTV